VRQATWDGLDFAALQMLMVDHRWNGQPGAQMDRNSHVSILVSRPDPRGAGMFAVITPGRTVRVEDDGTVQILDETGEAII
jgi:hypothetical protein